MHILDWNHFLMSPRFTPELKLKALQGFRSHWGKYQNSTQVRSLCWTSSFFYLTFSLTESSSGLNELRDPHFSLNFLLILRVSVAGLKNFKKSYRFPKSKFHYGFLWLLQRISRNLMGLNTGSKWHRYMDFFQWLLCSILFSNPLSLHQIS